jgi:putative hemolysin
MEIIIIALLILLNGLFSMSEIALVSSRKFKLDTAAKKGNANAAKALELSNNPNRFLSTVQIGITLVGILTGVYSGDKFSGQVEIMLRRVEFLRPYAATISVITIVVIITFFSIVFGELLPKRIGMLFPEKIATAVASPMMVVSKIASPFIWLLTKTNDLIMALFGLKKSAESKVTEEEIKAIIQDSTEGGEIQQIERNIVSRVFALGDRRVSELMTHRSDVVWLDINDDLDTVREKVAQELHSMYPVSNGELDKLEGVVVLKTFFPKELKKEDFKLKDYIKQPIVVHSSTPAYQVLDKFREHKFHYAIVVDEYGSIQGIMAMDDVLDALIGDISEYDQNEYQITVRNDNSWFADAQYPYFELMNYFSIAHSESESEEREFNTIGGLLMTRLGRVPNVGDKINWEGYEIEVVDMDGLRIDKVLITKLEEERPTES